MNHMITNTRQRIIDYLHRNKNATPAQLTNYLGITERAVSKQLKKLLEDNKIIKIGTAPKVFYQLSSPKTNKIKYNIPQIIRNIINKNYIYISPSGLMIEGFDGFCTWCEEKNQDVIKTAQDYIQTIKKYHTYKNKHGLIDGMVKMKNTFKDVFLDKIYYIDFYSIERFGKTKLGTLLLYAKQGQDKKLIKKIVDIINNTVKNLIKNEKINTIGFIPPTVKRKIQFIKELDKMLNINLHRINIIKVTSGISVPQKTLPKLEDRIENAKNTMFIKENNIYKNILLIDDAIGSGATLNEVAKKIKEKGYKGKIIGLALVGSFKGFDIISEI